jgi:putative membrane-bound dehydrogenase-like protein
MRVAWHIPLLLVAVTPAWPVSLTAAQPQVAVGFNVERVADEHHIVFPMFATFDEHGRLFVAESSGLDLYEELKAQTRKCRVKVLEDRNGDGRFETSAVFADKLVFPMGLVWRDGKLYVADPPNLVTFEDTEGDGRGDKRTVLLTGFGHTDNGSLHGLTFGPDGLLYLTMGSPDGYRLRRDDGTFVQGQSGALIRCKTDGTGVEVVCRGFVNLVEVVFTGSGEIIGTDNWYQHPIGGIRDALVHLLEGGLYPFEQDVGTAQPVTGEPLPALSLFPAVALSGVAIYRGDAFPSEIRGNLFSAQHNSRKVGRHVLSRAGSTFRSEDHDFVTSDDPDFHPSDILEDADGSLLVVDTGGWYVQHCPTGRIRDSRSPGGIYRVRFGDAPVLVDAYGQKLEWADAATEQLVQRLGDPRPAVRDRAGRMLVQRGRAAITALSAELGSSADQEAKERALWTLAQIPDDGALAPIRDALKLSDGQVVGAACRALARRGDTNSSLQLCGLLDDLRSSAMVRMAAAEALARCGNADSLNDIWRALTRQTDRFLDHALIYAAHRIATVEALTAALDHPQAKVQRTALLLLNQSPRPREVLHFDVVMRRVSAMDPELRQTALEILRQRTEWVGQTTTMIQRWLGSDGQMPEDRVAMSSLLLAFQNETSVQGSVSVALNNANTPTSFRVALLEIIGKSSLTPLPSSWVAGLRRAIDDPATRALAVQVAARSRVTALDDRLRQLAEDWTESSELRMEALRGVIGRNPKLAESLFELLLDQLGSNNGPVARLAAADALRRAYLTDRQLAAALNRIQGDALISPNMLLPSFKQATDQEGMIALIKSLRAAVKSGWRPVQPDFENALNLMPSGLQASVAELRELVGKGNPADAARLKKYEPLLTGGNVKRGREVFFSNKVACSTCHAIGEVGGNVGPDLTKVGATRSGRDLLESILLPSASFAQGYENYRVTTTNGEELIGILARQSADAVILRGASGAEIQAPRSQIQNIARSPISIMPEGLEQGMTADEFRDLLMFLQSLK